MICLLKTALVPSLTLLSLFACTGVMPRLETGDDGDRVSADAREDAPDLEDEEEVHEDPDALAGLIERLESGGDDETEVHDVEPGLTSGDERSSLVPTAEEIWAMSERECRATLKKAGVSVSAPTCDTNLVEYPVLLDSPIGGVEISAKWPQKKRVNEVMDCRLVVALIELAATAKDMGVKKIQFYSTYRPLKKPKGNCKEGKAGKKCRAKVAKYEKAVSSGSMSQHRRAAGIDIRWFEMADGRTVDVLEHYERNSGAPPCEDAPTTADGRFLKEFACALHARRVFNVMLTPNANKDHHNHFHFDISPGASWYIIR